MRAEVRQKLQQMGPFEAAVTLVMAQPHADAARKAFYAGDMETYNDCVQKLDEAILGRKLG